MALLFSQLPSIASGRMIRMAHDHPITHVITDSRKPVITEGACFFAIAGPRHDGHQFVQSLYDTGVRQFVVERDLPSFDHPDASVFLADSTLDVLQRAAAFHRSQYNLPVIGITGSNAKTIIKEWLDQLLSPDYVIVKNPGSYNSQLGVPLSVMEIREHHNLGIFEAGISRKGEMEKLANIIQPTIGVFTNIGSSHDEGFESRGEKIAEKLRLFKSCRSLIYCADHAEVDSAIRARLSGVELIGWGSSKGAVVPVTSEGSEVRIMMGGQTHTFNLSFREAAQRENAIHCIVLLLHVGQKPGVIQSRLLALRSIPMRLELKQGINQCLLIDDTYNNDVVGLHISLDFLAGQQKSRKVLILSDILQSGLGSAELAKNVAGILRAYSLHHFVGIGQTLVSNKALFDFIPETEFFDDTESFLRTEPERRLKESAVLVKGARPFQFEAIVKRLERKIHGTVMEVDLAAVVNNLNYFRSRLQPGVRLMVMVKAFAYGSGSEEVAALLQYHRVDYLGVAYSDEGVELRRNHITLPIMVMNPSEESFSVMTDHNLEPEIYSIKLMRSLISSVNGSCTVHLKIDSGMHRLGFTDRDLDEAIRLLKANPRIQVASIFTHLAGSDETEHDTFTREQASKFDKLSKKVMKELNISPMRHVLNSPGILRFPDLQFDMVRLGIGLHGVDPTEQNRKGLQPVATLKTIISQIRQVAAGETVGYGRKGVARHPMTLATIAIGYADGFSRSNSRGVGQVLVNGKRAPVVGNVCMDMTMIDITGIEAEEGDEVIIFGKDLPIAEVATRTGTIPYEVLTNTSERVKRIFHTESF
jgi:alanine racemase